MNPGPQLEDGFTRIANELLEAIYNAYFTVSESRVFWFVVRRTYGYGKRSDWISESQFCKAVHTMDRRNIARVRRELIDRNIISVQRDARGRPMYGVQKDFTRWLSPSNQTHRRSIRRSKPVDVFNQTQNPVQSDADFGVQSDAYKRKKESLKKDETEDQPAEQQEDTTAAPILELTEEELKQIEADDELTYWKRKAGIDVSDEHDV